MTDPLRLLLTDPRVTLRPQPDGSAEVTLDARGLSACFVLTADQAAALRAALRLTVGVAAALLLACAPAWAQPCQNPVTAVATSNPEKPALEVVLTLDAALEPTEEVAIVLDEVAVVRSASRLSHKTTAREGDHAIYKPPFTLEVRLGVVVVKPTRRFAPTDTIGLSILTEQPAVLRCADRRQGVTR
jgi:hypothetical protein